MAKNLFMVQFLQLIGMKIEPKQIAYRHLPSENDGLGDCVLGYRPRALLQRYDDYHRGNCTEATSTLRSLKLRFTNCFELNKHDLIRGFPELLGETACITHGQTQLWSSNQTAN